jgi:hypothetical protein
MTLAFVLAAGGGCSLLVDVDGLHGSNALAPDAALGDTQTESSDRGGTVTVIGRGTGKDGPLTVTTDLVVNAYTPVIATARAGALRILTEDASVLAPGDLVLVWRPVGLEGTAPGDSSPIVPSASDGVGRFQLARVASSSDGVIEIDHDLAFDVAKGLAQLVRVPEYSTVDVAAGALLRAKPWDGRVGGVVALLAQERVTIDGVVAARAAGGRGGRAFLTSSILRGCNAQEGTPSVGYAATGEGVLVAGYDGDGDRAEAPGGRGNRANGAGGGNCHNAGGGGGGSGGPGGMGGLSWDQDGSRPVGGAGGAPLVASLAERIFMGGGGGAGEANIESNDGPSSGAAGGGVVLIRAQSIDGAGSISADGADALPAGKEGGGGGGAGGSIFVECEAAVRIAISAAGGKGAETGIGLGPGGGGAGGRIRIASSNNQATTKVEGGASGRAGGSPRGATAGAAGIVE